MKKKWAVLRAKKHHTVNPLYPNEFHYDILVMPLWQSDQHSQAGHDCICSPTVEMQPGGNALVVHHEIRGC